MSRIRFVEPRTTRLDLAAPIRYASRGVRRLWLSWGIWTAGGWVASLDGDVCATEDASAALAFGTRDAAESVIKAYEEARGGRAFETVVWAARELPIGDWIEVRDELSVGESFRVASSTYGSADDPLRGPLEEAAAYLRRWSADVPIETMADRLDALANVPGPLLIELRDRIADHEDTVTAEITAELLADPPAPAWIEIREELAVRDSRELATAARTGESDPMRLYVAEVVSYVVAWSDGRAIEAPGDLRSAVLDLSVVSLLAMKNAINAHERRLAATIEAFEKNARSSSEGVTAPTSASSTATTPIDRTSRSVA